MNSDLLSLSKLFTERVFRIPDYQRGYAWLVKQLEDFWNDLEQLNETRGHYAGVLTLEETPEAKFNRWNDDLWIIKSKSYKPYYVVDGQQRLTTAIILIQVITEALEPEKRLNYTSKEEIIKRFLFDQRDPGLSRTYIFGYEEDNPSYEFLKTNILGSSSTERDLQTPTIYTINLEGAKRFFKEKVARLDHAELEKTFHKLTQRFLFNIFTIENDVEVCVAFETMNNRGKPLSGLELLKNRLIYLSTRIDADDSEKERLRRVVNNCWKSVYYSLGKNPKKPLDDDEFLKVHYAIHFKEEVEDADRFDYTFIFAEKRTADHLLDAIFSLKSLDEKASDRMTLAKIYAYVSSLQSSVENWYALHNPDDSSNLGTLTKTWMSRLGKTGWKKYQTFLLSVFENVTKDSQRGLILKSLERYIFISEIRDRSKGQFWHAISTRNLVLNFNAPAFPPPISGNIEALQIAREIDQSTDAILSEKGFMKTLTSEFGKVGFYSWSKLRYFLFEYNEHIQVQSKSSHEKLIWEELNARINDESDFTTVEHIYPQAAQSEYWTRRFNGYSKEELSVLKNSLGNLLPLSKPKNSSLGNRDFADKVAVPDGRPIGYQYGCYSENEIAGLEEWLPANILSRGLKMVDFLETRWNIPFEGKRQKIEFLGLGFVKSN